MDSSHAPVREVLSVLAYKINESPVQLNGQEISNSLFGLRYMSCYHIEVSEIMLRLARKIAMCNYSLSSYTMWKAWRSLKAMCDDNEEMQDILFHALKLDSDSVAFHEMKYGQ
jgi:hypothetical protein